MIKFYNKIEFKACLLYTLQLWCIYLAPHDAAILHSGQAVVSCALSGAPRKPFLDPLPQLCHFHISIFKFWPVNRICTWILLSWRCDFGLSVMGEVPGWSWKVLTHCTEVSEILFLNKNFNNFLKVVNSIFFRYLYF